MTIQKLWNDYKKLCWWKKIVLFLPLVLMIVFSLVLLIKKQDKNNDIEYIKDTVDNTIKLKKEKDKALEEEDKILEAKQNINKEKIETKENELKNNINSINASNSADELLSIHKAINNKRNTGR